MSATSLFSLTLSSSSADSCRFSGNSRGRAEFANNSGHKFEGHAATITLLVSSLCQ